MATGGRAATLIALLKLLKDLWPYIKEIIDLFKGLSPSGKQAVLAMISEFADLPDEQRTEAIEQLRATVAATGQPE